MVDLIIVPEIWWPFNLHKKMYLVEASQEKCVILWLRVSRWVENISKNLYYWFLFLGFDPVRVL